MLASLSWQLSFCLGYFFRSRFYVALGGSFPGKVACRVMANLSGQLTSVLVSFFRATSFYVAFDGSFPEQIAYRVIAGLGGQLTFCLGWLLFFEV